MSRKKTSQRCLTCRMRFELCLCSLIEEVKKNIQCQTKVVILMHHREEKLTTNTGRLASLLLPDCEIRLRGLPGSPLDSSGILESHRQALFLYPSEKAKSFDLEFAKSLDRPITLIVADGSWRQASKVPAREAFLKDVPHIIIPEGLPTQYHLRREPKVGGLATFEAIARVLGTIEGAELQAKLENVFHEMVKRTLASRSGKLTLD